MQRKDGWNGRWRDFDVKCIPSTSRMRVKELHLLHRLMMQKSPIGSDLWDQKWLGRY
jgi:hypothetical protein